MLRYDSMKNLEKMRINPKAIEQRIANHFGNEEFSSMSETLVSFIKEVADEAYRAGFDTGYSKGYSIGCEDVTVKIQDVLDGYRL